MLTPPMPYSGGKQWVAKQIVDLFPPHAGYIEPFAGALSALLAKTPSELEVVNDLDGDIVAFWRVLRDQPEELERVCALTPHSRLETVLAGDREGVSDLERARRARHGSHPWHGQGTPGRLDGSKLMARLRTIKPNHWVRHVRIATRQSNSPEPIMTGRLNGESTENRSLGNEPF